MKEIYSTTHKIQHLTIKTPFLTDESIVSWLLRASLNQGCKPETFLSFYWDDKSLWKGDTDKGFNDIDKRIHADMAVLAESTREQFDNQAETVKEIADSEFGKLWLMPMSKVQTVAGSYYCPLCFSDDKKSHLKTNWRMLWYSHCHIHKIPLQSICTECQSPYKPLLLPVSLRFINHCHECGKKLDLPANNRKLTAEEIVFEDKCLKILAEDKAVVFGNEITANQWFDYLGFLIEFLRITISFYNNHSSRQTKYANTFASFLSDMGIDIRNYSNLTNINKKVFHFHLIPYGQRFSLITSANYLAEQPLSKWIKFCKIYKLSRVAFNFNGKKAPSFVFLPVYERLPRKLKRIMMLADISATGKETIINNSKELFEEFDTRAETLVTPKKDIFQQDVINNILVFKILPDINMPNTKALLAELYFKPKPLSHEDFLSWVQLALAYFHEACISIRTINTCSIREEENMLVVDFLESDYYIPKPQNLV